MSYGEPGHESADLCCEGGCASSFRVGAYAFPNLFVIAHHGQEVVSITLGELSPGLRDGVRKRETAVYGEVAVSRAGYEGGFHSWEG